MAATLLSDTSAAEGASHIVRLNLPGITARSGSSLDTHAHRSVLKPAGTASSWLSACPTRLRTLIVVLINIFVSGALLRRDTFSIGSSFEDYQTINRILSIVCLNGHTYYIYNLCALLTCSSFLLSPFGQRWWPRLGLSSWITLLDLSYTHRH